jgi:hypothetical protein
MCRDEVMMEAEDMSGAPPGSQAFLGSLQDATTKLWGRLSAADQQSFSNLARKWSEEAPPPNVQSRCVTSGLLHCSDVDIDISTEWLPPCVERLSVTFKPSYIGPVECDA